MVELLNVTRTDLVECGIRYHRKTPEITANCRQVIWLRGMRYTVILI